jgi:[ribosomal protein S5]-alanine N-acetyltransferase
VLTGEPKRSGRYSLFLLIKPMPETAITRYLPTLNTERLILSPFTTADADAVESLAGHEEIARGAALTWIATHAPAYANGCGVTFAVRTKDHALIGCVALALSTSDQRGELAYWLGVTHWNQGFITEAARACIDFGFSHLKLHKISARHFAYNPASGRVMEKLGMQREGCLRQHTQKAGAFHDVIEYGLLKTERT